MNADGQQVDGPLVYRLMDGQSAAAFYVDRQTDRQTDTVPLDRSVLVD